MRSLFEKNPGGEHPPEISSTGPSSKKLNAVTLVLTVVILGLLCFTLYESKSTKRTLQEQLDKSINSIGNRFDANESRMAEVRADLSVIQKRIGVTQKELEEAQTLAQQLKREQQKAAQQFSSQLSQKADATQLSNLRQEAESKFGAVSGDISAVKGDVTSVKGDVATTRKDLETTRRELIDARDYLNQQIARNHDELTELKRKGERDYFEFDIPKKGAYYHVGDVNLLLKKADPKRKKYDVVISVDDNLLEKRERTVNEPVQFLVGKTKLRYEVVVNTVAKNRITGYLSAPKDKALAAERSK